MKTRACDRRTWLSLLAAGLSVGLLAGPAATKDSPSKKQEAAQPPAYRITGPYTHENLTIFLIHGDDQLKGKTFLTLEEALEQKKVIVHETKNVNQLTIENVTPDIEIYIQSGEIVKGGQQDRTIAFDLILPPKQKMPITSFCVEAGRWTQRGKETVTKFSAANAALPSKDAKIAVKEAVRQTGGVGGAAGQQTGNRATPAQQARGIGGAQGMVWKEVAKKQMLLGRALGKSVQSEKSKTSLQLTLEDKKLLETVDGFTTKLKTLLEGKKDVIGYAFAINGQMNSADIYGSKSLFQKLWPKLLAATVVEAISEKQKDKKFEHPKVDAVTALMKDADKGKTTNTDITKRVRMVTQETSLNYLYQTLDLDNKAAAVHKNYIKK
jgi:hypothetical protein